MIQKNIFKQFLCERFPDKWEIYFERFEQFHAWLVEENRKINLFSRRTDPADIWITHFLDSALAVKHVDFGGCKILDFGTGGGLPGIPLAIIYGGAFVTLLDSRKKKIEALKRAALHLNLENCAFWDRRLEELPPAHNGGFDVIVSRSVKIEPAFKNRLLQLLKPRGKLVLYKSRSLEDAEQFKDGRDNIVIHDAGTPELGERKIVVITK